MLTTNRTTGPKTRLQTASQAVGAAFLLVGHDTPANFVPVNSADNWLHLILSLAMIALAVLLSRNTAPRR